MTSEIASPVRSAFAFHAAASSAVTRQPMSSVRGFSDGGRPGFFFAIGTQFLLDANVDRLAARSYYR